MEVLRGMSGHEITKISTNPALMIGEVKNKKYVLQVSILRCVGINDWISGFRLYRNICLQYSE